MTRQALLNETAYSSVNPASTHHAAQCRRQLPWEIPPTETTTALGRERPRVALGPIARADTYAEIKAHAGTRSAYAALQNYWNRDKQEQAGSLDSNKTL